MEEKKKVINTTEEVHKDPMRFLDDVMLVGSSNAIELQESQGQKSFVESYTLPVEGPFYNREPEKNKAILEAFGFKLLGEVPGDPIFQFVEMPAGWKKVPTEHPMWSDVVDDKGRKRLAIFYKAAFYDRSAHYHFCSRFTIEHDYKTEDKGVAITHVKDGEKIIFSTVPINLPPPGHHQEFYASRDLATKTATKWLVEHYPDWQNPGAYWDAEPQQNTTMP
jgi:hypothetical protein